MSDYKPGPKSIVDELAQFIRQVDGNHRMGAGALADKICERFRVDAPAVQGEPVEGLPAMMKIEHHSPGITIEKDFFGTVHIKLGDFDYIQIQYQYPHTDNARQLRHATLIADALAGTSPQPAEQQPDRDVRMLAASLYQACGAYDMPTRVLDVLSAAANGEPFAHMIDGLLPCVPPSNQDVQGDPVGAEPQPCPEGIRDGAPYDDPEFESLCREYEIWGTPAAAQCAVFWEAGKRAAEQKPAPDIAGLVNDAERWRYVRQFLSLDDVGDEEFCLGLVVDYEGLESAVTPHAARLHAERCAAEWVVDADYVGDISPLPPVTVEQAVEAAIEGGDHDRSRTA